MAKIPNKAAQALGKRYRGHLKREVGGDLIFQPPKLKGLQAVQGAGGTLQ